MLSPRIITFFCLLWSAIFPCSSVGAIVTKFYRRLHLFGFLLKWCKWIITTLIFFTDFFSRITIYVCTYNILTICVVTSCPFISLKTFFVVFNWFCSSLVDSNESSTSAGHSRSILSSCFFTKFWFSLQREVL